MGIITMAVRKNRRRTRNRRRVHRGGGGKHSCSARTDGDSDVCNVVKQNMQSVATNVGEEIDLNHQIKQLKDKLRRLEGPLGISRAEKIVEMQRKFHKQAVAFNSPKKDIDKLEKEYEEA